jgi:hypothetical protein
MKTPLRTPHDWTSRLAPRSGWRSVARIESDHGHDVRCSAEHDQVLVCTGTPRDVAAIALDCVVHCFLASEIKQKHVTQFMEKKNSVVKSVK